MESPAVGKVQVNDNLKLFIYNTHMKKDDLVKVIRAIVKQEIKKELPAALAQIFSQMMGQAQPQIHSTNAARNIPKNEPSNPKPDDPIDEMVSLKSHLQEMFNGGEDSQKKNQSSPIRSKKFTNNPVLNEILNQTRPFNNNERMANRVGGGGLMSPGVMMAAAGYESSIPMTTGPGEMMSSDDLNFMKNVPGMPGTDVSGVSHIPASHSQPLREGQEGGTAPLESLGDVSALDLKNHPALPDSIKGILTRDYRSLVRAMDKKKK